MGWAEVLDDMERRLAQASAVLSGGPPPPAMAPLPPHLGPLPAALVGRARQLKADTDRLAGEVGDARLRVAAGIRGRTDTSAPAPAYVDTTA